MAYVLLERLRAIGLVGTVIACVQVGTRRVRLFKIGAVTVGDSRRVRFFLASVFPRQKAFLAAVQRLAVG